MAFPINMTQDRRIFHKNLYEILMGPISMDLMQNPINLRCGHVFDEEPLLKWLDIEPNCPNCTEPVEEEDIRPAYLVRNINDEIRSNEYLFNGSFERDSQIHEMAIVFLNAGHELITPFKEFLRLPSRHVKTLDYDDHRLEAAIVSMVNLNFFEIKDAIESDQLLIPKFFKKRVESLGRREDIKNDNEIYTSVVRFNQLLEVQERKAMEQNEMKNNNRMERYMQENNALVLQLNDQLQGAHNRINEQDDHIQAQDDQLQGAHNRINEQDDHIQAQDDRIQEQGDHAEEQDEQIGDLNRRVDNYSWVLPVAGLAFGTIVCSPIVIGPVSGMAIAGRGAIAVKAINTAKFMHSSHGLFHFLYTIIGGFIGWLVGLFTDKKIANM